MRADISLAVGDTVLLSGDRITGKRSAGPQQIYYVRDAMRNTRPHGISRQTRGKKIRMKY